MPELPTVDEPRPDRCGTCRFWELEDSAGIEEAGRCHAHPPSHLAANAYFAVIDDDEEEGASRHSKSRSESSYAWSDHINSWGFPATAEDDWCGEWQPKAK